MLNPLPKAEASPSPISAVERRRREAAVRFATASVGLEGFVVSEAEKLHQQRFIDGELTLEEYVCR